MGADGYLHDDAIGRTGIEAAFEASLRGQYGSARWERDGSGRLVKLLEETRGAGRRAESRPHHRRAASANGDRIPAMGDARGERERGVTIVMNPQTGEILAMVSMPGYDNNAFAAGISEELYQSYLADPNLPLRNHAVADIYPPGSTFKLVTGLAALQEGVTSASRRWPTCGCYQIPGAPPGDCLSVGTAGASAT